MHYLPLSHLITAVKPEDAARLVLLRGLVRLRVCATLVEHNVPTENALPYIAEGIWDRMFFNLHSA